MTQENYALIKAPSRAPEWNSFLKNQPAWFVALRIPGAALVVASFLKVFQLAVDPFYHLPLVGSRWLTLGVAEVELLLGLWLLSGIGWRWAKIAGIACYGTFAVVNLAQVLQGSESCGCFGRIDIDPSYMLAFDGLAILMLVLWRPKAFTLFFGKRVSFNTKAVAGVSILLAALQVTAVIAAERFYFQPASKGETGATFIVLEPEKWIGNAVPILWAIESPAKLDFGHGEWILVFYQAGCHECQTFLEELATSVKDQSPEPPSGSRIVLIDVSQDGSPQAGVDSSFAVEGASRARLKTSINWFMQTPIAARVCNAVAVESTKRSAKTCRARRNGAPGPTPITRPARAPFPRILCARAPATMSTGVGRTTNRFAANTPAGYISPSLTARCASSKRTLN